MLTGLSSMATRQLLTALSAEIERTHGLALHFESAGGVEVAQRVRDGEAADLLVLAAGPMAALERDGLLVAGTLRPLFVSIVVAAVPEGVPPPELASEDDLRAALVGASRIGYSTGPSGDALLGLIERWGLSDELRDHLIQARPGVPVGSLLTGGEADLGFQQLSELRGVTGVRVVGPLPGEAAIRSIFSGATLASSGRAAEARQALDLLSSPSIEPIVTAHGMSRAGA